MSEMHDSKGCSMVIAHTAEGKQFFESLGTRYLETTHEESHGYNLCIVNSHTRVAMPLYFGIVSTYPKTLKLLRNSTMRILELVYYKHIKGIYFHSI